MVAVGVFVVVVAVARTVLAGESWTEVESRRAVSEFWEFRHAEYARQFFTTRLSFHRKFIKLQKKILQGQALQT